MNKPSEKMPFISVWIRGSAAGGLALLIFLASSPLADAIWHIESSSQIAKGALAAAMAGLGLAFFQWYLIKTHVKTGYLWFPACVLASISVFVASSSLNDQFAIPLLLSAVILGILIDGNPLVNERNRIRRLITLLVFSAIGAIGVGLYSIITVAWYSLAVEVPEGGGSIIGEIVATAVLGLIFIFTAAASGVAVDRVIWGQKDESKPVNWNW